MVYQKRLLKAEIRIAGENLMKITRQQVTDFLILNLGTVLITIGIYFFKFPNNFSIGGVSGIAVVAGHYTTVLSTTMLNNIINIALLAVGFVVLGRGFGFMTAYSTILMSVLLQVLEIVWPMTEPFTDQPFLELMFAVMLPSIGSAMIFNIGGSNGGTEIIAMIFKKYTSVNIGTALMACDLVISLAACVAFGMETGLFSLLGLILKAFLIDYVIESINLCKYFTIVCQDPVGICRYINTELGHSATVVQAKGAYSGLQKYLVLVIVRKFEAVQLRRTVKQLDPTAFMMITNTSEIIGKGFRGNE